MAKPLNLQESSNDYSRILVNLNASARVILCAGAIQFILQLKRGNGPRPWCGISYCVERQSLLRCIRECRTGRPPAPLEVSPAAMAALHDLPSRASLVAVCDTCKSDVGACDE